MDDRARADFSRGTDRRLVPNPSQRSDPRKKSAFLVHFPIHGTPRSAYRRGPVWIRVSAVSHTRARQRSEVPNEHARYSERRGHFLALSRFCLDCPVYSFIDLAPVILSAPVLDPLPAHNASLLSTHFLTI